MSTAPKPIEPRHRPPTDLHRTLPHNLEAEQGVLGSMLISPTDVIGDCVERINEQYFYQPAHATIYTILVECWKAQKPADVITLTHTRSEAAGEAVIGIPIMAIAGEPVMGIPKTATTGKPVTLKRGTAPTPVRRPSLDDEPELAHSQWLADLAECYGCPFDEEGKHVGRSMGAHIDLGLALLSCLLRPGESLTSEDMAAWCGCSRSAIQSIERRALAKVRDRLVADLGEPALAREVEGLLTTFHAVT